MHTIRATLFSGLVPLFLITTSTLGMIIPGSQHHNAYRYPYGPPNEISSNQYRPGLPPPAPIFPPNQPRPYAPPINQNHQQPTYPAPTQGRPSNPYGPYQDNHHFNVIPSSQNRPGFPQPAPMGVFPPNLPNQYPPWQGNPTSQYQQQPPNAALTPSHPINRFQGLPHNAPSSFPPHSPPNRVPVRRVPPYFPHLNRPDISLSAQSNSYNNHGPYPPVPNQSTSNGRGSSGQVPHAVQHRVPPTKRQRPSTVPYGSIAWAQRKDFRDAPPEFLGQDPTRLVKVIVVGQSEYGNLLRVAVADSEKLPKKIRQIVADERNTPDWPDLRGSKISLGRINNKDIDLTGTSVRDLKALENMVGILSRAPVPQEYLKGLHCWISSRDLSPSPNYGATRVVVTTDPGEDGMVDVRATGPRIPKGVLRINGEKYGLQPTSQGGIEYIEAFTRKANPALLYAKLGWVKEVDALVQELSDLSDVYPCI